MHAHCVVAVLLPEAMFAATLGVERAFNLRRRRCKARDSGVVSTAECAGHVHGLAAVSDAATAKLRCKMAPSLPPSLPLTPTARPNDVT